MIVGRRTGCLRPVPGGVIDHGFADDEKEDFFELTLRPCS